MTVWINNGKRMEMSWPIRTRGMQKGETARASLRITDLNGPGREYFSFTYELVWKGFGREDLRACGVLGRDTYLRSGATSFNALHIVPLAFDLHLCNVHTGEPIHAHANALYWCGTSKYQDADPSALSRHLRVDIDTAKVFVAEVRDAYLNTGEHPSHEAASQAMRRIIDGLRPEWKRNADDLRQALEVFA